jgi:hypothetical protein
MRRLNCPEIHEQPWFPQSLRDEVTETLQFIFDAAHFYRQIATPFGAALRVARTQTVLDLCSGAGGPWIWLRRMIADQGNGPIRVILTDRYPNLAAGCRAQKITDGAIEYRAEPVDAQRIPVSLGGFRTIFSSLHHFVPDEIVAMLRDAVEHEQGIGFFEVAKRRPRTILYACFMPVAALCLVPFMRPFRFARLVWTYLLPVVPFVLLFDGVLSCLRAYLPGELREMASRICASKYKWEIGESGPVTYLIGYPEPSAG